ncbi:DUF4158 domain-containing protein [Rhizobium ruizarguesonis]
MSNWERQYLGLEGFPKILTAVEVEQFFTLIQLRARRSELNSLAPALQIGFLKMTARPLNSVAIVPIVVLEYLGHQLKCTPPHIASIRAFYRRGRTLFDHQATAIFDTGKLMASMRSWLVNHHYPATGTVTRNRSRCVAPSGSISASRRVTQSSRSSSGTTALI